MTQDVALLRQSIANWTIYDQGIEALSKSVASTERRRQEDNKSMTLNDMLIKVCELDLMDVSTTNKNIAHPTSLQIPPCATRSAQIYPC